MLPVFGARRARSALIGLLACLFVIVSVRQASALPVLPWKGAWTPAEITASAISVHMALLRDTADTRFHSRVIWWNDEHHEQVHGGLYGWRPDTSDLCVAFPDTSHFQALTGPDTLKASGFNMFCAGLTQVFGKLIVAGGGEEGEVGIRSSKFYDPASNTWSDLHNMNTARWYPSLVELPSGDAMVSGGTVYHHMQQYGGKLRAGKATETLRRLGLRSYAGGHWEDLQHTPLRTDGDYCWPPRLEGHTLTEAPSDRPAILFGGRDTAGVYKTDTYFLRYSELAFRSDLGYFFDKKSPVHGSAAGLTRADHVALNIPDPVGGTALVVFGGRNDSGVLSSVYWFHWDALLSQWSWDEITTSGSGPSERYGHTAIYDEHHQRMLVFGGADSTGGPSSNTVYALNLSDPTSSSAWTTPIVYAPSGTPSARVGATLTLDPRQETRQSTYSNHSVHMGRAAYLYGGTTSTSLNDVQHDVWQLWVNWNSDSLEWVPLSPDSATLATARAWHSAMWDQGSARVVIVGGESGTDTTVGRSAIGLDAGVHTLDIIPSTFQHHWEQLAPLNEGTGVSHGAAIADGLDINAKVPETISPGAEWTEASGTDSIYHAEPWYPFLFVMPNGDVFNAGSGSAADHYSAAYSVSRQAWRRWPADTTNQSMFPPGSAVMFIPGHVMACGSRDEWFNADSVADSLHAGTHPAVPYTQVIDITGGSPQWHNSIDTLHVPRVYHNLVLLPTGEVMVVGGLTDKRDSGLESIAARNPEIWSPDTVNGGHRGMWRIMPTFGSDSLKGAHAVRDYHSSALLLPDGRVMTAGGNLISAYDHSLEFYCPPYLFNADGSKAERPEFNGITPPPEHLTYGQSFFVCVSSNTVPTDLDSVVLMRPGAATHGFDESQRFIRLPTELCVSGGRLQVTAPANANLAPPGDYLMFLVYKNIVNRAANATPPPRYRTPSIARWVRLGDQFDTPVVCNACPGGGCPYLDVASVTGWLTDNTVLGRSATGALASDAYRLRITPEERDGVITVRLRENEKEVTSLNGAKLVAVDHPAGTTVIGTGDSVAAGTSVPVVHVATSRGEDLTPYFGEGGLGWWGSPGDTVYLDLDSPRAVAAMQSGGDGGGILEGDPKDEEIVYNPGSGGSSARMQQSTHASLVSDADWLTRTGIRIQRLNEQGEWSDVQQWYPRQYASQVYLPGLGHGRTRLIFVGRHKLTFAGRLSTTTEGVTATEIAALSARHSRLGNVASAMTADGDTTFLAPGDTITLQFAAPQAREGSVRDYVLVTHGLYTSDLGLARLTPTPTGLPLQFALRQNQPNPFGAATTIKFELPQRSRVKIEVFDLFGRRIKTLTNQEWPAGYQHVDWDRTAENGSFLHAGVFMYRITAGSFRAHRKMVLLSR